MTFEKIIKEVTRLKCDERRTVTDNYCEVVVPTAELVDLNRILHGYFGVPMKPEGETVLDQAKKYSKDYGGIMVNQTMYCRMTEGGYEVALLWPWSCGTAVTVKIGRQ